jgi:outer membrane protein assembly factor BamB
MLCLPNVSRRAIVFGILYSTLSLWGQMVRGTEFPPASNRDEASEGRTAKDSKSPAAIPPGEDWPCFLGPRQNGTSSETGLLKTWPKAGPAVVWEMEIGTGYSAPSVLGHRLVLHHRIGRNEIVECLHARTGKQLWKYESPSSFRDPYGYNNGPRCTPLLTEHRCYTLGAEGRLLCLELETGKKVWEVLLKESFDIPEGFFGVGATPVLWKGRLIVAVGGQPNSGLVAFDAETGKVLWQNVGKSTWDGEKTDWPGESEYRWEGDEMVVSYSSPMTATIHGRDHLLCLMRHGLVSVDPETGQENFHYWFRSRTHESVNAAQPVVDGDTILLGAAYRVGSVCLKVAEDGQSVVPLWRDRRNLSTHWSTAILHQGCYFGFSGRHENEGMLQCVDAKTGALLWETPGWEQDIQLRQDSEGNVIIAETGEQIPWPFYGRASAILVDGMMIILAERGTLALLKPERDRWNEVSRCRVPRMKYPCWTAPVFSRGYLYLRCEDALVCLNLMAP